MGLEEQLVRGAYGAAYTPRGSAMDAVGEMGKDISKMMLDAHGRLQAQKDKDEIDAKAKKEKLNKDFNILKNKILKSGGSLGVETYDAAFGDVEELQKLHSACADDDEQCRGRVKIQLNTYADGIDALKEGINGLVESTEEDKNGRTKISASQTNQQKEILNQVLNPENRTYAGINDSKILELSEKMKTASSKEKAILAQEIESLERSNTKEWGFNVNYEDADGNQVSKRLSMDDLNTLVPIRRDDFSTEAIPLIKGQRKLAELYKTGGKGGEGFNSDNFLADIEDKVTEENISSIYHDDLLKLGKKNTLKEQLKTHPIITNMSYSDLGLDAATIEGSGGDGIIDKDELKLLTPKDQEKIMDALTNTENPLYDFDRSKEIALDWMTRKSEQEFNKATYGNPNITEEEKKEFHTPRVGESKEDFVDRGGILGAIDDTNVKWNETLGEFVSKSPTQGMTDKEKANYYANR